MSSAKSRIVYIAGYGRSGSTVMDAYLGSAPKAVGMGEVTNLFRDVANGERCSCGAVLEECPQWGACIAKVRELGVLPPQAAIETLRAESLVTRGASATYYTIWREVLAAMDARADVLIDSSKVSRLTFWRIARLRALGYDVHVVHLWRGAEGLVDSWSRGSNREQAREFHALRSASGDVMRVLRSFVGWVIANIGTRVVCAMVEAPRLVVSFDRFVASQEYRHAISSKLGLEEAVTASQDGAAIPMRHGVAGNRFRARSSTAELRVTSGSQWRHWIRGPLVSVMTGIYRYVL